MHVAKAAAQAAARVFPSHRFEAHVLATEWVRAPATATELYAALRPVAAIHFGVSSRARTFEIETLAKNRAVQAADACGDFPLAHCLSPEGPEHIAARLPVAEILARLRRRGIPAVPSRDAGGYLCNALLYHASDHARRIDPRLRVGFVHLPAALDVDGRRISAGRSPRIGWHQAVAGALEIIAASLRQPPLPSAVHRQRFAPMTAR